jgi:beta-glucanase (GH16 family)
VRDGSLVITTRRDPGRVQNSTGKVWNFSSAWVTTGYGGVGGGAPAHFLHAGGRWEVRAMLPPIGCPGAWPAHWLMPRTSGGHSSLKRLAARLASLARRVNSARFTFCLGHVAGTPCWPMGGEIDIMEMWGKEQQGLDKKVTVSSTYHYGTACGVDHVAKKNRKLGHYPLLPWAKKQVDWDTVRAGAQA